MEGQTFLLWAEASITCLSLSCPPTSMGTEHEKTDRCGGGGAVDLGSTVTRGPLCSLPHGSPPGVGKPAARVRQQKQTDSDTGLASRAQGQERGTCEAEHPVSPAVWQETWPRCR